MKSQLRNIIMNLKPNSSEYVSYGSQSGIYSQIAKCKQSGDCPSDAEFSVTKLYALDSNFTEIRSDVYEITRKN